jgi:hypothetical protein
MGTADRALRIIAAIAIIGLYYAGLISGTWAIILLVLSVIFILTSFISFCPVYYSFHINTNKTK